MKNSIIKKRFNTPSEVVNERNGYIFVAKYYNNIPNYIGSEANELLFENKANDKTCSIAEALYAGKSPSIKWNLEQYSQICYTEAKRMKSEGGTRLFYINRADRLSGEVRKAYNGWMGAGNIIRLADIECTPQADLMEHVQSYIDEFEYGLCVPSQGDFHERNILTDGTIVDFEGAGWNLIATDVATFIWHTLFAGQYFGPKYAKWANKDTLEYLPEQKSSVSADGAVSYLLNSQRQVLMREYLDILPARLDNLGVDEEVVKHAIAYRLLTTFQPQEMSDGDMSLSFSLATLFASSCSLSELIRRFIL